MSVDTLAHANLTLAWHNRKDLQIILGKKNYARNENIT
jgi:hypothetical protein